MTLTILGLLIWAGAHFWKRISPDSRARFGDRGKAIVAVLSVFAIVLMVVGYRGWDGTVYWGKAQPWTGINNLLILLAFYLFAASGKKTRITRTIRHPQLTAVVVWSVAHIMVNGDTPSFVLFSGLAIWAIAEMIVVNRAEGPRGAYHAPPIKSEWIAAVAALVLYIVVAGIHAALGYNPFG